MRLADLKPQFMGTGGEGVTRNGQPVPRREGIGLMFQCPCGSPDCWCYVPFANPLDGEPPPEGTTVAWQRTGETFETLTLTPSILRKKWIDTAGREHGCGWHGFITSGEVVSC